MTCRSPNCRTSQAEGSHFCQYHKDLFAAIRAEIDDGKAARLRSPERKRVRRTMFKACDVPGCDAWAAPRESRCLYHLRTLGLSDAQG